MCVAINVCPLLPTRSKAQHVNVEWSDAEIEKKWKTLCVSERALEGSVTKHSLSSHCSTWQARVSRFAVASGALKTLTIFCVAKRRLMRFPRFNGLILPPNHSTVPLRTKLRSSWLVDWNLPQMKQKNPLSRYPTASLRCPSRAPGFITVQRSICD